VKPGLQPFYSGRNIKAPTNGGKHFLHLDDFTKEELQSMLDLGLMAKKKFYARDESFKPLKGQTMAMVFTKPSARTRVSFETVRSPPSSQIPPGTCEGAGNALASRP
jgi:ornithine carbamoyltransferase